ncbi:MAG: hypothetical protein R6U98_16015 [Pirellulaceae bacterium]
MAATETPTHAIACDAGPLIHLDELGCLTLLSDFARVLLPASVWQEVSRHRAGALDVPLTMKYAKPRAGEAALIDDLDYPGLTQST